MNFININVKSFYTLLGSIISPKKIVDYAFSNGSLYASINDDVHMYGVPEFLKRCEERKLKPVVGIALESEYGKISLFAKNYEGYKRLMHHSSYYSLNQKIDQFIKEDFTNIAIVYPDMIPEEWSFDNAFRCDSIIWNKVEYVSPDQAKAVKAMKHIKNATFISESELQMGGDFYLKTPAELSHMYSKEILLNTEKFLSLMKLKLPELKADIYHFPTPDGASPDSFLETLCLSGLEKQIGSNNIPDNYKKRLDYELEVIEQKGFANYFLILWDVVKWARGEGIYIGPGRGSAAGSLISYSLGITEVNPIKFDLLFERFLNPERISMPDIDIDIEDEQRERVIAYMFEKYGSDHVSHITTFSTMKIKMGLRDVGRILQIPLKEIDEISKSVPDAEMTVSQALKSSSLLQIKNVDYPDLFEITEHLLNCPRQVGTHAAGIILCNEKLTNRVPLQPGLNGTTMSQFSMDYLEELGLIKMDFLGLRNLTTLKEIMSKIKKHKGVNISLSDIPLNDKKTFKLLSEGKTSGIFQLESPGMKSTVKQMQPTDIEGISAASALFRPGPQENIPSYVKRRHNKEQVEYVHETLIDILKPTYGIIVYQEQVMQIARKVAGFSLAKSDTLRRAMGKKDETKMEGLKKDFVSGALENGYTEEKAKEIYAYVQKFASYGFNRSHSIAYSIIGYWLAFLKANFPVEFMASLLSSVVGNEKKTYEYILEAKRYGIQILGPSINKSFHKFAIENNQLRFPLLGLKSFGQAAFIKLFKDRMTNPYEGFIKTIVRISSNGVNSKSIESLVWSGAFDEFGINRTEAFKNLSIALEYKNMVYSSKTKTLNFELMPAPSLIRENADTDLEVEKENSVLGFNLKYDSNSMLKEQMKSSGMEFEDLSQVMNGEINKYYKIFVNVDKIKTTTTKTGSKMAFIDISDDTAITSMVAFANSWEEVEKLQAKKHHLLKVKKNKISMVLEKMEKVGE